MGKPQPDTRALWNIIYGHFSKVHMRLGHPEPENAGTPPMERVSGLTYQVVRDYCAYLGVEPYVPDQFREQLGIKEMKTK